jgi:predicted nucleotidyltransferase
MNTYKLKYTRLQNEIFRFFCINAGKKFNQREVAKHLEVSPAGIKKALIELEEDGILLVEKSKSMNLSMISLNRNPVVLKLKQTENLKQIYTSGLASYLQEKYVVSPIILFGSYSRGEDTVNSDIDIAIVSTTKKKLDLKEFEKKLHRTINLSIFEKKDISKEFTNTIINGITICGVLTL